jgi:F0F1-type ATP synthase epsilon subunit
MQAAKVTDNQNQISAAGRLAAENYDLEKSEEARKKAQQESEQQGKNQRLLLNLLLRSWRT